MSAPKIKIKDINLFERDVHLRLPFKFGVVTLRQAPQAFCQLRIETKNGGETIGVSAELMVPKWFDKNETLSNEDNFDQLRTALDLAKQAYLAGGAETAFGTMASNYHPHIAAAHGYGLNPLTANFGTALIDRAVMDALCRGSEMSFAESVRTNLAGIQADDTIADLNAFDFNGFLAGLTFQPAIHARHTVGMADPLTGADQSPHDRVDDGLPETLEEIIDVYGHRYFKIKVRGEIAADIDRLKAIAAVLDQKAKPYKISLDGNEQYETVDGVLELIAAIEAENTLAEFWASTLFIEQPIKRAVALSVDVHAIADKRPVIIDESDEALDTYLVARERGYGGVSSKNCKGFYKSIINSARCRIWNDAQSEIDYFMSAEDLTCQAGVAVQQDLALVSLLGLKHVERNGHHYVNGMAGADEAEQLGFLKAHQGLYSSFDGKISLKISEGQIDISSLNCPGFATAAFPDFKSMREMTVPAVT